MKTLAEYLADYVETEMDQQGFEFMSYFREWITEGINAYQSTENCDIVIAGGDCPDCGSPMTKGSDTMFGLSGDKIDVGIYSCDCGYEIQY